jgi:hypothetical protein
MYEFNETDMDALARVAMHAAAAKSPGRAFNLRWYTGREQDKSAAPARPQETHP